MSSELFQITPQKAPELELARIALGIARNDLMDAEYAASKGYDIDLKSFQFAVADAETRVRKAETLAIARK